MNEINEVNNNENVKKILISVFIILIIACITIFFAYRLINKKTESKNNIANSNVIEAAGLYSKNVDDKKWKSLDDEINNGNKEYEYFCITVEELLKTGVLKDDEVKNFNYSYDTYVVVSRDKQTKVVETKEIVEKNSPAFIKELCTGNSNNFEKYIPNITDKNIYTDEININIDNSNLEKEVKNKKDKIKSISCLYSDNSSNLDKTGIYKDNICIIDNLKANADYWVRVCVETNKVKSSCTTTNKYTTKDIEKPTIKINDVIDITFSSNNIKDKKGIYYFKLTSTGMIENDVYACDDKFNCSNEVTKSIDKDVWYKSSNDKVSIKLLSVDNGKVIVRVTDKSNNYKELEEDFLVRKVKFSLGEADKIDDQTNDIEKYCVIDKDGICKLTSPTISKYDSEVIGWNIDKNAESSIWNVKEEKEITENLVYYPVIKQKPLYVYYHSNGGEVSKNTKAGKWSVNDDGIIELNGKSYLQVFNSKDEINANGLINYNNYDYLNISNKGMIAKEGYEWNTNEDGTGTSFSQDYAYTYNELIKHAKIEKDSYRIDLYVNWTVREYTINYYLGTGSSEGGNELLGKTYCKYNEECQLVKFNSFNKEFPLKENGWEFYGWLETNSILNENKLVLDYRDGQKFVYDMDKDLDLYGIGSRQIYLYNGLKPTSPYKTLGQNWNPYKNTTDKEYCGYFTLPKYVEKINGWDFLGYKSGSNSASAGASYGLSVSNLGNKTTLSPGKNNILRGLYGRIISLEYDPNGGEGEVYYNSAKQYYNTGYSVRNNNVASNISAVKITLRKNEFTPPNGKEFAYWGELTSGGKTYNEREQLIFSTAVTDKNTKFKVYAIWKDADVTPPTNGTLIINNGDKYTNEQRVKLTLFANDATRMCISLTEKCETGWKPYSTSDEIFLSSPSGNKNIYVWYRDKNNNTTKAIQGSIYLDLIRPSIKLIVIPEKSSSDSSVYESVKVTAVANDNIAIDNTKYCITDKGTCSPSIQGENVNLPTGNNRVCFRTRDKAGNYSDTKCTDLFNIKEKEQITLSKHLLSNNISGLKKSFIGSDNLYRFSGASGNTAIYNYICLGESGQTCVDGSDDMYRIIGIEPSTGYIKVIKQTKAEASGMKWYSVNGINVNWQTGISNNNAQSDLYSRLKNSWYYKQVFNSKIVEHTWYVGDVNGDALNDRSSVVTAIQEKQITSKVGILSLMDFYLAHYSDVNFVENSRYNTNWIGLYNNHCNDCYEWTMTRDGYIADSENGTTVWRIHPKYGIGYYNVVQIFHYRPTFYLDSDIMLKSGTGTASDPFIITY